MRFCPLYSGSSGNALFVEGGGVRLLVDAGLPGRSVADALEEIGVLPDSVSGILVTHEHSDHIRGVGVMARRYGIPVYANVGTWEAMESLIGEIPEASMRIFETGRDFYIGSLNVLPFPTSHDAADPVGFAFEHGHMKLSLLTDSGYVNGRMLDAVERSDLLLLESNHDVDMLKAGSYPYPLKRRILSDQGHLSNETAGATLAKLYMRGVKNAILGHLSKENNFESLALETVRFILREADIPDGGFSLSIAHRERIGSMYEIV